VLETLATPELVLVHVTVRPVRTFPFASRTVATAWVFCPTMRAELGSETDTDATVTAMTVTVAEPARPSLVAVIVAEPATRALTSPEAETVATVVLLDDHVIVRPLRMLPPASRVTAESWVVAPA